MLRKYWVWALLLFCLLFACTAAYAAAPVFPDFGLLTWAKLAGETTLQGGGMRALTYETSSRDALNTYVRALEKKGYTVELEKSETEETARVTHPSAQSGFSLLYVPAYRTTTMLIPSGGQLGDMDAVAAFWFSDMPYVFADPTVGKAVRETLGIAEGTDVMGRHLNSIKELRIEEETVSDLSDLSHMTRLEKLSLENAGITDISALKDLTALTQLSLSGNPIADIRPLASLTSLETLILSHTSVKNISSLAKLSALRRLDANDCLLTDVWAIGGLANLDTLDLRDNEITGLPNLSKLTKLRDLKLDNNQIADLTPVSNCATLRWLAVCGNKVKTIKPLASLENLRWLKLDDNPLVDYTPLWGREFTYFSPELNVILTPGADGTLCVEVMGSIEDIDPKRVIDLYIKTLDEDLLASSGIFQHKSTSIGEKWEVSLFPATQYEVKAYMGSGPSIKSGHRLYTPPKPARFAENSFSLKRAEVCWLPPDADAADYAKAFREGNLGSLSASTISLTQIDEMLQGKRVFEGYVLFSSAKLKQNWKFDCQMVIETPLGERFILVNKSFYELEEGYAHDCLMGNWTDHLTAVMEELQEAEGGIPLGKYTIEEYFNERLACTIPFTVVP